MDIIFQIVIFFVLLGSGYFIGRINERNHYKSISKREHLPGFQRLSVVCDEPEDLPGVVNRVFLVSGSAVISIDYFKKMALSLRTLFGGRVKSMETLLDRARREAILRAKENAIQGDANLIMNLRVQTSTISGSSGKNSIGTIEVIAYGTAVVMV